MIVRRVEDVTEFAGLVEPRLAGDPVGFSVLAVSLGRVLRGEVAAPDAVWWVAETPAGDVVAAGQHWPDFPVGLHGTPDAVADEVGGPLSDLLLSLGRQPSHASGPRRAVLALARAWRERTGEGTRVTREMGRWVLGTLVSPAQVPGSSRLPDASDVELVLGWVTAFHAEIRATSAVDRAWAESRVAAGTLVLWQVDGRPVSLAGATAPEAGVSRVGPVWTPVELRGRGYGSAVTAAATQSALDRGASAVCLYTDLANPVSNEIYARLGYAMVGEEVEATFGAAPG